MTRGLSTRWRWLVGLLAASAVAIGLWLGWSRSDRGTSESPIAGLPERQSLAQTTAPVSDAPLAPPSREEARSSRAHADNVLVAKEGDVLEIQGSIQIRESGRTVDSKASGSFDLTPIDAAPSSTKVHVTVSYGTWSVRLPGPVREIEVTEVLLGGRRAEVLNRRHVVYIRRKIDLVAEWVKSLAVHVVDAETRLDLTGVLLVSPRGRSSGEPLDPAQFGSDEVLARGDSPLHVEGTWSDLNVWAFAPGHAPEEAELDLEEGGEPTIELMRAAQLEIIVRSAARPEHPVLLCLRDASEAIRMQEILASFAARAGESSAKQVEGDPEIGEQNQEPSGPVLRSLEAPSSGVARVEGLSPGEYLVTAELDIGGPPVVLAKGRVTVIAGETASLTLDLANAPPIVEPVPLEGKMFVPAGWRDLSPALRLELIAHGEAITRDGDDVRALVATPVPGSREEYSWDAGRVPPGRYRLELMSPHFHQELDVGIAAARDVDFRIPGVADVNATAVDEASGEEIAIEILSWTYQGSNRLGGDGQRLPWLESRRLQAPVGAVTIAASGSDFEDVRQAVELVAGPNDVVLHVRRGCGLILTLTDDGKSVAWQPRDIHVLEAIDGNGQLDSIRSGSAFDGVCLRVSAPGRYRLTLPRIPGYAPIPPEELTIERGPLVHHTIVLRR